MIFSQEQISAFRFWIQGYPLFYEPIVAEYFRIMGYDVEKPVVVPKADIERTVTALFDGYKRLGPALDQGAIIKTLRSRQRLQPDLLIKKAGRRYLVELKSWGGSGSGKFDLVTAKNKFMEPEAKDVNRSAFLLVDWLQGERVDGKILVASARSPQHAQVLQLLTEQFNTSIELLYLDEIFAAPQLSGIIEKYLAFLDAAVAELKQAIRGTKS